MEAQLLYHHADSDREAPAVSPALWRSRTAATMIQLTRLNNQPLVVNSDLIKFVERAPDTVLTLVTGEKIIVRETAEEVLGKIVEFRRNILSGLPASALEAPTVSLPAVSFVEPKAKES